MSFFPSSVPTALQLLDARNNKSVTLSSAINDVVTTIPVTDTSDIPTAGYLTFEDGSNEVIQYTGVTPTSLTGVTRGADGTTASSHSNGGTIGMWGNAKYHNVLSEEIVAITQNLSDRLGLSATQILAPLGTAALPTYSFTGDPNTGIYGNGADRVSIATNGTARVHIDNSGFMNILGLDVYLAATNKLFLDGGGDTYIHENSGNEIRIVTGGTLAVKIDSNQTLNIIDGSAASPALTFSADPDTGIYRPGANQIYFTTGGVVRMGIDSAGNVYNPGTYYTEAGSASVPAITFNGDTDTGLFRDAANRLGIAAGAFKVADFRATSTADATDHIPFSMFGGTSFGGGTAGVNWFMRTTASVSTSAVEIGPTGYGMMWVTGVTGGGSTTFIDCLIDLYSVTPIVVSSLDNGGPAARTYSRTGDRLYLTMASGTYSVALTMISVPIR